MSFSLLIILLVMVGCNSETYEPIAEPIEEVTGTNENRIESENGENLADLEPQITVFEVENPSLTVPEEALSSESVARIIANFITRLFEEDINGKYIEITYSSPPLDYRTYWTGNIAQSPTALNQGEILYHFRIDAVYGRLMDLIRKYEMPTSNEVELLPIDDEGVRHYTILARGHIRSFIFTEIQGISLVENPNLSDNYLFFVADIGMGYEAEITIQRESERLVRIETFFRQSGMPRG